MQDCLFCKIAEGQVPAHIVYEDDETIAFLDINPRAPGHTMVISKAHASSILELPDMRIGSLFSTVKKVAGMINKALKPDGFTMGINHGKVSGQTVDHLHFHIIPRWSLDKGGSLHGVVNNPPKESLEEVLKKIKGV